MSYLPLANSKPENTKPYKDWLRSCGIENVVDEDYTMRIWENWTAKDAEDKVFPVSSSTSQIGQTFVVKIQHGP
jgi:hypothetical protein